MGTHLFFEGDLSPLELELITYMLNKNRTRAITDDDIINLAIDLDISVGGIIKIMRQKQL